MSPDYEDNYKVVRDAVRTFLAADKPTGVQKVYRDMPWWIPAQMIQPITPVAGLLYGAALFIHIDSSRETRNALPAPQPPSRTIDSGFVGNKAVTYAISVGIIYQYTIPSDLAPGTEEDDWVVGLDKIVDKLKARIRSDPNLGNPDVVWQAGQSPGDLQLLMDLPTYTGGYVQIMSRLTFTLIQIITA